MKKKYGMEWVKKQKKGRNHLNLLARPAGFEPATYGFVVRAKP